MLVYALRSVISLCRESIIVILNFDVLRKNANKSADVLHHDSYYDSHSSQFIPSLSPISVHIAK